MSAPVPADPDKPCPHEDFTASVDVNRLTSGEGGPVTGYSADIRVQCAGCGEPFRWIGVQAGLKPDRPMVSVDETELHAPLRPASSDPDFGLGIPGYAITLGRGMSDGKPAWLADADLREQAEREFAPPGGTATEALGRAAAEGFTAGLNLPVPEGADAFLAAMLGGSDPEPGPPYVHAIAPEIEPEPVRTRDGRVLYRPPVRPRPAYTIKVVTDERMQPGTIGMISAGRAHDGHLRVSDAMLAGGLIRYGTFTVGEPLGPSDEYRLLPSLPDDGYWIES